MVRIRYVKSGSGFVNKNPVLVGTQLVSIVLDVQNASYTINNKETEALLDRGVLGVKETEAKTKASLVLRVRQQLLALGANFQKEARLRRPIINGVDNQTL